MSDRQLRPGSWPAWVISVFLGTAEVVSGLLRSPVLVERWEQPSALARLGVSGLAGHLARAVLNVERWLDEPPPPASRTTVDAVEYFRSAQSASHRAIASSSGTRSAARSS